MKEKNAHGFDGSLTWYLRHRLPPVDFHSSDQDILPDIRAACSQQQSPTKLPHHCKFEITVHATVKQGKTPMEGWLRVEMYSVSGIFYINPTVKRMCFVKSYPYFKFFMITAVRSNVIVGIGLLLWDEWKYPYQCCKQGTVKANIYTEQQHVRGTAIKLNDCLDVQLILLSQ